LTLALLQRIRDEGLPMPALAILISPWVEMLLTIPNNSLGEKQIRNDILSPRISRSTVLAYLGKSGADPADPMISPINMDFTGIPPMIVQWGGQELFSSQIRELCARAEQAGIRVMRDADPDMFHIYQMLGDFVGPRATRGLERLCAMMAVMITHEMGSNGRCGGPGPRKRTPPRPNKARSLYGVKAAQSAFSIMTTKSAAGRLERPVNEES
jgi:monoterpene epsilon-lactone hydrolase